MAFKPCTVEEIFKDYSGRRTAILRALTQEVDQFYRLCDPENDKLCLYGHPNEAWEVTLPAEEVPAVLPLPADRGINLARNDMNRKDWLSQVALCSDSWLIYMAFYHGALLNHDERESLFSLINNLPTIFEAMERIEDKPAEDSESKSHGSSKDEDHEHHAESEEGQAID